MYDSTWWSDTLSWITFEGMIRESLLDSILGDEFEIILAETAQ